MEVFNHFFGKELNIYMVRPHLELNWITTFSWMVTVCGKRLSGVKWIPPRWVQDLPGSERWGGWCHPSTHSLVRLLWHEQQRVLLQHNSRLHSQPSQRGSATRSAGSEGTDPRPALWRDGTRLLWLCWKGPGRDLTGKKGEEELYECFGTLFITAALLRKAFCPQASILW